MIQEYLVYNAQGKLIATLSGVSAEKVLEHALYCGYQAAQVIPKVPPAPTVHVSTGPTKLPDLQNYDPFVPEELMQEDALYDSSDD